MSWQVSVGAERTELIYPEEERSLTADNAYEVLVIANRPQEPLIASRVINIKDEGNEVVSRLLKANGTL